MANETLKRQEGGAKYFHSLLVIFYIEKVINILWIFMNVRDHLIAFRRYFTTKGQ